MACGQDFLQGRLSPAEAAKVKEHVRLCPRCRPKFEEMGGAALLG
jgi:predicted anti-sigma-YlaC factor YlaD